MPIIVGETATAIQMSDMLLDEGVFVTGFGFPVVPQGQARVRCQITAAHTRDGPRLRGRGVQEGRAALGSARAGSDLTDLARRSVGTRTRDDEPPPALDVVGRRPSRRTRRSGRRRASRARARRRSGAERCPTTSPPGACTHTAGISAPGGSGTRMSSVAALRGGARRRCGRRRRCRGPRVRNGSRVRWRGGHARGVVAVGRRRVRRLRPRVWPRDPLRVTRDALGPTIAPDRALVAIASPRHADRSSRRPLALAAPRGRRSPAHARSPPRRARCSASRSARTARSPTGGRSRATSPRSPPRRRRCEVDTLGATTQGRPFIVATISSPANMRRLEAIRPAQARLADPRGARRRRGGAARRDAAGGGAHLEQHPRDRDRVVADGDGARAPAGDERHARSARLRDVVVLLVPSMNPDGQQMITEWYRQGLGTRWEGGPLPWLYHHYVGPRQQPRLVHGDAAGDAARHRPAVPPLVPGGVLRRAPDGERAGMRIFVPPLVDPVNPNLDPLIVRGINHIGARDGARARGARASRASATG